MVLVVTETSSISKKRPEPGDISVYKHIKQMLYPEGAVRYDGVGGIGNIFKLGVLRNKIFLHGAKKVVIVVNEVGFYNRPDIQKKAKALFRDWNGEEQVCLVVVRKDLEDLMVHILPKNKAANFKGQVEQIGKLLAPQKFIKFIDERKARQNSIVSLYVDSLKCEECGGFE